MASFVSEVLTSAGQLETQEATAKLQQLSKKIATQKRQVYDVTVDKYSNFPPKLHNAEQLAVEVESIKGEMQEVGDRIQNQIMSQLNTSTGEFQSLTGKLEDVNCLLVVLEKLVHLQDGLEAIETDIRKHEYSKAADSVHLVKSLLAEKVYNFQDEITILSAIQEESHIQKEKLINELYDKWKELIQWTVSDDKASGDGVTIKTVVLKINTNTETARLLEKVVIGMKKMNILSDIVKKFGERVFTHMIKAIIEGGSCTVSEKGHGKTITVTKVESSAEVVCPAPVKVFEQLDIVLSFLNKHLLHVASTEADSSSTLMSLLGEIIANDSLHLTVKQCLIKAIPSSNKELEEFTNVITLTETFHKHLVELRFIHSDNTILQDYVQNVNTLFANKKCQEILERARMLMTVEVHNTVKVSHEKPLGELPPLLEGGSGGKKARRNELTTDSPLSVNTFRLPTCLISSSIQEFMALVYETLHEATQSSPQCAIQLFCAVRSMFELFCSVFPTYHKQRLETLPQFTAIHYNNCMFIAHHLMTLGHQFSKKLPNAINATFVDLVPKIRRLGTDSFLHQLLKQKAQVSEYLAAANGFLNISEKMVFLASERAVKQVLHQLQHLKKVWQDVLPPSNFRKAMGGLVNSVIVEITDSIVALEDISADDTKQLSLHLSAIANRVPELLQVEGDTEQVNITVEIQRNVAKWQRFRELDMVLNASMIDISDRWAAGKGPLAVVFSANEVKQLVRALFQNTDRRSQMLAKIK